ncbi:GTP-binding protein [Aestuariicella hydrocarbonica]|uniref:GTP-binding protein n=1 Tax=Pseudomaricurvus hydrocarbonicus TaxID=1470433 RepID=A0A9E5MHB4_9GAMM|nr:GTP-binding protein [Aestuariicella hydrocarbonica]NHO65736.1 GTP-binding protein [Aestuariicella hydrocarbonica]
MNLKTAPIPVTVVSGFLGSGKTTLLNRILSSDHGLKIAVMVNDFGDINIDSELIVSAEQNTLNLANGCICCTVESDLIEQLRQLHQRRDRPDHILIETSGVSNPSKVVSSLRYPQFRHKLVIDGVITLLDADQFSTLEGDMKSLAMDQLAVADIVVINKTDLASDAQLQQLREQWLYPNARVIETQFAEVPLVLLFGQGVADAALKSASDHRCAEHSQEHSVGHSRGECQDHCLTHIHEHSASIRCTSHSAHAELSHGQMFATLSWQSSSLMSLPKLRQALQNLPASIYRVKGFVHLKEVPDQRCVVHVVGSRVHLEKERPLPQTRITEKPADSPQPIESPQHIKSPQPTNNQLVLIGLPPLDQGSLSALFEQCAL